MLGYTFLAINDATINFKTRELRLGGMSVHCLSSQLEDTLEDAGKGKEFKGVKNFVMNGDSYVRRNTCYYQESHALLSYRAVQWSG